MLDYVLFTMTPAGTAPMWGDSDFGRALGLGLDKDFWDFRPILSAGAALFGRGDWKFAAGQLDEEAFWILGSEALDTWEQLDAHPPEQTSRTFPHAGLYIIRDIWTEDTDVAFFRCGPFGFGGESHCAHAHCDLLSIVLWMGGQPILVDSGTYIYHGPLRDHFRLTAAHNTVRVDDREQAIPMPNFNWRQIPQARCIDWNEERVVGALTHSVKMDFVRELTHPRPGVWQLVDKFIGREEHSMEWFFHFDPSLELQLNIEEGTLMVVNKGEPFLIVDTPDRGPLLQVRDSWFSYRYGVKQRNRELYAQWQGQLKEEGVEFCWQFRRINERLEQTR
jgi:hypothetical protein